MKDLAINKHDKAAALLRVASYLGRPQKFMAVADARAEMRRTLELASKGSVILTTHGEPEAAVVPFTTLEDMRRALLQLLASEIETSFARAQDRARSSREQLSTTSSDEEVEELVSEALRAARRRSSKSSRTASRR